MPEVLKRNNVKVHGSGKRAMMFAHGFGCDQNMWRFVDLTGFSWTRLNGIFSVERTPEDAKEAT